MGSNRGLRVGNPAQKQDRLQSRSHNNPMASLSATQAPPNKGTVETAETAFSCTEQRTTVKTS